MSTFKQILDTRFGGVISKGGHNESEGKACSLELLSVKKKIPFTYNTDDVRCFDFCVINDMDVPDKLRTEWMLRMLETYEDSFDWSNTKKEKVVKRIIVSTVNQFIADLPGLSEELANQCKAVKTRREASMVADAIVASTTADKYTIQTARVLRRAVDSAMDYDSDNAASQADNIMYSFVEAVIEANPDPTSYDAIRAKIFTTACEIWLEAAKD